MMSSDPDQIRQQIEETRVNLSQGVNTLADTVNPAQAARSEPGWRPAPAITGVKDKVMGTASQSVSGTGSTAGDKLSAAQGAAHDTVSAAQDKMSAARSQAHQQASGNPLAVGLIAVGVGWLVGSLWPAQPGRGAGRHQGQGNRGPHGHQRRQGGCGRSPGFSAPGRRMGQGLGCGRGLHGQGGGRQLGARRS